MLRRSVVGLGALLGGFHLWLLGNQAWNGELSDPSVVFRWLLALALGAGLVAIKRRGGSLFGRQAVAMWVLAAVLHGPAFGNDLDGFSTPALPEAVVTLAQAAATLSAVGLALLVWFRHTVWAAGAATGLLTSTEHSLLPHRRGRGHLRFLPRPPPLA